MSTPASASRPVDAERARWKLSRAALASHLRVPMYREGYALVLNSALVSLFGVVYWLLAARNYPPHVLGLNVAAIAAMMFLAGVSQLNLMSALVRFIPVAGRSSTRFVVFAYLLSGTIALVVALVFVAGVDVWAPALDFLSSNPAFVLWFVAATIAWCVFNLQDSVLTALRTAVLVPVENLVYSIVKIVLLVALVEASPHYGIFASWTAALVLSLVPVNLVIFRRLLPSHTRSAAAGHEPPTRRQVARFVSADYVGSLFWLSATTLMPVIVTTIEGATANAYFSLAWMIALPLYAVSASTGASFVVTASRDEARLSVYARQVLIQTAAIVIPLALGLALASHLVLRLFGSAYAGHAAVTLALLALSAIPNMITALYVSVYRVRRKVSMAVRLLGALCGLALVLGVVLLEALGIAGVGLAWLVSQSTVAAVLLLREPRALWPAGGGDLAPGRRVPLANRLENALRNVAAELHLLDLLVRARHLRANRRWAREAERVTPEILRRLSPSVDRDPPTTWTQHRFLPTVSDLTVVAAGPAGRSARAVIKLPRTDAAERGLRHEREVLATLNAEDRLRHWRSVLPVTLAEGELAGRLYVVQRMMSGVAATRMLGSDDEAKKSLSAAAATIGELHRRTAVPAVASDSELERWVDAPVYGLRRACAALDGGGSAIDRLAAELREALAGRTLSLAWVHGDFVPSNVLVSADAGRVVGVLDWEHATSADLPALDVVALLLSTRAQRQHQELGSVVRELVTGAPWTEFEQQLLDPACEVSGGRLDSRALVLLWWMRHVVGNLTKSSRYTSHGLWARWNVAVVLDALNAR